MDSLSFSPINCKFLVGKSISNWFEAGKYKDVDSAYPEYFFLYNYNSAYSSYLFFFYYYNRRASSSASFLFLGGILFVII